MSTETHTRFTHKPFRDAGELETPRQQPLPPPPPPSSTLTGKQGSLHTHREDTGFTHAQNIEPVTFRPPEAFNDDLSPQTTWRPTGRSVMKRDFPLPTQLTVRITHCVTLQVAVHVIPHAGKGGGAAASREG